MPSKLAWHFQSIPGWAAGLVNSEWVKVIDPPAQNPFHNCKTIGRVYVPDNEANAMVLRRSQGAREWYGRCLDAYLRAPWVWCWEGPNEPPVATAEQRSALVSFTREWVGLMRAAGHRTVALCLGVGWPDIGQARDLAGALDSTDYWAVHEYGAPTMRADYDAAAGLGWLCLRYRRTVAELRACGARIPPLLITECGIDGGTAGRPGVGWNGYCDRAQYQAQVVWYDGELRKDDYVQTATIFTSGPNWDWTSFDVDETLSGTLHTYIAGEQGAPVTPPVTPPCGAPIDAIRSAGWVRLGVPLNPDAALYKAARARALGRPVTCEFTVGNYVCQGFDGGIVFCPVGQWGNVDVIPWDLQAAAA